MMVMGGVDATQLNETPLEIQDTIAEEVIEVRQVENVVEATAPWKDQAGLTIKYDMGEPTLTEKLKDERKEQVIYDRVDFGDGGFKVDILLNEKPDTNRFCYQIEGAENYDFFYQPELTPEEIAEGASRPPEIVGSYAVYHKTLKNHVVGQENYATGKVMHIPRPQVWELGNEENKVWADLSYDAGQLCVTVPQDFLDKSAYPVRVDPTFGYTTIGASGFGSGTSRYKGMTGTTTHEGRLVSVSVYGYGSSAATDVKVAVYDMEANLVYGNETAQTMPNTSTSSLYTFAVYGSLAGDTGYIAMSMMQNTGIIAYDAGGSSGYRATTAYGAWADPVTWSASNTAERFSVYATYEPNPHGVHINNGTLRINNGTLDL